MMIIKTADLILIISSQTKKIGGNILQMMIMINTVEFDVILMISGLVDPSGAVDWRLKGCHKDIIIIVIIIMIIFIIIDVVIIITIIIIIITDTNLIYNAIITCG